MNYGRMSVPEKLATELFEAGVMTKPTIKFLFVGILRCLMTSPLKRTE